LSLQHPRTIGWVGTTALAIGGCNQSLFLLPAILVGQDTIPGQGSAAVLLLIAGVVLAWAALPGWIELVMLSPNRVGGIAAVCTDAFRPYSPMVSGIVGCCYWWGWIPTCGLAALIAAGAIHRALVPMIPTTPIAIGIVTLFFGVNLLGVRAATRLAIPLGIASATLSFFAAFLPIATGRVDWHLATTFTLATPFPGWFGNLTSLMAGLYLIGFGAPAFEAAACHVGETIDPVKNVPRAMFASAALAGVYFVVLPVVLLGVLGPTALGGDLAVELGPRFAPIVGSLAKAFAVGFVVFNMLHGALQPLAGASRTLSQLADDGIFPRVLARRTSRDVPWVATTLTAVTAIGFLIIGDPLWLIAAANFTYLIAIGMPSIAVLLLRRNEPERHRPYRAPRGSITAGLVAAGAWLFSAMLGFEQFGLATVILGLVFAYSGAGLFVLRRIEDHRRAGRRGLPQSLHVRLTQIMVVVLAFDGTGYYFAIRSMSRADVALVTALQDIFVSVALLTVAAALIIPRIIADDATRDLADINVELRDNARALEAEIGVRRVAEERLSHVAFHDDLTGLANRASFMSELDDALASGHGYADRHTAVLFLDLNRFKIVNDSLGHHAGDRLLVEVAHRLRACVRDGVSLARFGGDEFTFLLHDLGANAGDEALAFGETILRALAPAFDIECRDIFATASVGVALARCGSHHAHDLLRDADIAMYRAKDLGRHRCVLFAPEFLERAVGVLQMQSDLRGALDRREFVLFYQPIVALATNALIGFEALIRWEHPERGLLAPATFIEAAEESDMIADLGAFVLGEATRQARMWRDEFGEERPLAISVNVSARQFANPRLLDEIKESLASYALDASYLNLEITESAFMVNPDFAAATMHELRAMGIEVHLDDFGTGYSSLGYLQRFPVSTLKIDRSFVHSDGSRIGNPQIVGTIASLARSLSLETTAEGIETAEQFEALRAIGCTNGQGYYISRPLNVLAATAAIASWDDAAQASFAAM